MERTVSAYYWLLRLDLAGGRIIELKYKGDVILGSFDRIDGKKGNTHLCVPNFGNEGKDKYSLPFHGPSRNMNWEVVGAQFPAKNAITVRCYIPKTAGYPAELAVTQEFSLEADHFLHHVTVENVLGEAVPVNIGVHNYWNTQNGWEGTLLNGEDITQKVKDNGSAELQEENIIAWPGGKSYRYCTKGFADAVLWTGRKDGTYDNAYVCIEPVVKNNPSYFGSEKSLVHEGKTMTAQQSICIT